MHGTTIGTGLLNTALDAFKAETGIPIKPTKGNAEFDAFLNMKGAKTKLPAIIKKGVLQANLPVMINQVPKLAVLITEYINAEMAKTLKRANTQFIDTAGNAYIKNQNLHIQIMGNKRKKYSDIGMKAGNRAFEPTGLKVIFALLRNPKLINAPYREIAKVAGVANGAITWVIKGLTDTGFLHHKGAKEDRELLNIPKLIDRWVEAYPIKLQNKQLFGVFEAENQQWWQQAQPERNRGVWGGEVAAEKYTEYLNPENTIVYLPEGEEKAFILKNRLRAAKQGKVEHGKGLVHIHNPFWQDLTPNKNDYLIDGQIDCAPPLLVYAELLATGDLRNRETAEIIYDKYLTPAH